MICKALRAFGVLFLVSVLVACSSQMQRSAALSPQYLRANPALKDGRTGLPYFLPDTVVPVTVAGDFVVLPERKSDAKDWKPQPADYEYVLTVTVGTPKQVADPDAALMLEYVPEAASDDVFKLGIGANGLLSTVKSTSTDQSAAIILKLAELVKEAAKAGTSLKILTVTVKPALGDDERREACYSRLQKMTVTTELNMSDVLRFDAAYALVGKAARYDPQKKKWTYSGVEEADQPLAEQYAKYLWSLQRTPESFSLESTVLRYQNFGDPDGALAGLALGHAQQLNRNVWLAMQKAPLSFSGTGPVKGIMLGTKARFPVAGSVAADVPGGVEHGNKSYAGVVFRLMVPRRLSIDIDSNGLAFGGGCVLRSVAAYSDGSTTMVADPTRTFVVDNSRGVFVKKRVDLLVTDGVLNGIEVDKPSELLAIISLPVDVLKTIASIPAEILSVKVKQISDERGLTSAQVELLKAQIDLIKQKQALTDAQNAAPQ
jgi:hypothetical protein